jgi:hypothetical protein
MTAVVPTHIDWSDWPELSYRLGLTDGVPTFPPERSVVDRLIAACGRAADEIVGAIPPSGRPGTIEALAANCVMAGCAPDHVPVVLAALEAMLTPRFNLSGVAVTTHPAWPLVIVSGRAVDDLAMASGESLFSGGGARANVAIGRAIKLILWNVGGAYPRQPVQEVLGHPGRFSYCIAEEPHATPWPPLHTASGVDAPHGAVTVFGCEGPQIVIAVGTSERAELMLDQIADQMRARGNSNTHTMGETLVVLSPQWVRLLDDQGWTRDRAQEFLFERSRRRLGDIRRRADGSPALRPEDRYPWWPDAIDQTDPDVMVPTTWGPSSIHLVVAGGDSLTYAAVCPGWGIYGGFAETRPLPALAAGSQV